MNTLAVLITGAFTGIGRATPLAFAREGARVVVSGRHNDEGQKLVTELCKFGTEADFLRVDVRHEEEVKNLVDQTIARCGRLDIAVDNARHRRQARAGDKQTADAGRDGSGARH
jgi:NAD(P)-dependent dehydrogenase (short-subunit alcohol dehydrogenase family)